MWLASLVGRPPSWEGVWSYPRTTAADAFPISIQRFRVHLITFAGVATLAAASPSICLRSSSLPTTEPTPTTPPCQQHRRQQRRQQQLHEATSCDTPRVDTPLVPEPRLALRLLPCLLLVPQFLPHRRRHFRLARLRLVLRPALQLRRVEEMIQMGVEIDACAASADKLRRQPLWTPGRKRWNQTGSRHGEDPRSGAVGRRTP